MIQAFMLVGATKCPESALNADKESAGDSGARPTPYV